MNAADRQLRVALSAHGALFREGLGPVLVSRGVDVIAQKAGLERLLPVLRREPPDIVLLELPGHLLVDVELDLYDELRRHHPQLPVLVLADQGTTAILARLSEATRDAGFGYVTARMDSVQLRDILIRVAAGEQVIHDEALRALARYKRNLSSLSMLTNQERVVLRLAAEGRSNEGISRQLHLSPKTVELHLGHIFAKLGLPVSASHNRRVLAVLLWHDLHGQGPSSSPRRGQPGVSPRPHVPLLDQNRAA